MIICKMRLAELPNKNPPIKAPTTPTIKLPTSPNPRPFNICPANQPATKPISRKIMMFIRPPNGV